MVHWEHGVHTIERTARASREIEAELRAPGVLAQLAHYRFAETPDSKLYVAERLRVELCLTGAHRSARARFPAHWSPGRFERIGALFVVPPGQEMLVRSAERTPLSSIVCELDARPFLDLFEQPPQLTQRHLSASLDVRDTRVRNLLLRLAAEAKQPGFASGMLVESIATQLAVELFRHGTTLSDTSSRGGLASWQLRLIDERIREVHETPTVCALAALCRLSVRQLTRAFRASRGCSIGVYVAQNQMEHAKRLLATDESVTSIAGRLGFSSSSNFCFAFRRAVGVTPGQFRQTLARRG